MGIAFCLGAVGLLWATGAGAQNPRFVREFIAETNGILAEVDTARSRFAADLGDPAGQGRPAASDPAAMERFQKNFGGTMEKFGSRVKKLAEGRQRAERTMSQKEVQFTGQVHGDLLKLIQQVAMSKLVVTEPAPRRAVFFEEMGKQTEALRKKLREYQ
jgi:hypothetical protein